MFVLFSGSSGRSDLIDVYDANNDMWSTAVFTGPRIFFTNSAASLSAGLVFFAGGSTGGIHCQ